jgi:hypothetical protein
MTASSNGNAQNGEGAQDRRFGTLAVHAGSPHDPTTGAVIAPVSSNGLRCILRYLWRRIRTNH